MSSPLSKIELQLVWSRELKPKLEDLDYTSLESKGVKKNKQEGFFVKFYAMREDNGGERKLYRVIQTVAAEHIKFHVQQNIGKRGVFQTTRTISVCHSEVFINPPFVPPSLSPSLHPTDTFL